MAIDSMSRWSSKLVRDRERHGPLSLGGVAVSLFPGGARFDSTVPPSSAQLRGIEAQRIRNTARMRCLFLACALSRVWWPSAESV